MHTNQTNKLWYLLVLFTLWQLAITLLSDGFVLSFDESIWHYIGRNWFRNGLVPYAGGADNKSPFVFAIFGVSDLLFGVNYWFARVVATLCQTAGIYYLFRIAQKTAGEKAAVPAAFCYGMALLWHATGSKYVAFTETYETMFLLMAINRYLQGLKNTDLLLSGILAGLALDFRLSAAFVALAIMVHMLSQKKFLNVLWFAIGVVSGVLLLVAVCMLSGISLRELTLNMLTDNFSRGSATDHTIAYKLQSLLNRFVLSPLALLYPLAIAGLFARKQLGLIILWLLAVFVVINFIGIYDVVHLKEILPPLAVLNGCAIAWLLERYQLPLKPVLLIICVLLFPGMSEVLDNAEILLGKAPAKLTYGKAPYINPTEGDRKLLGKWVRDNTQPHNLVLVHSFGTQVQAYSERISPSTYFNITQTPVAKARFMHDLERNKPAMILIPMFPEYYNLVDADLRLFVSRMVSRDYYLERCMYNYKIYRVRKM
ncbi:glycosyltransferase family 39 protein [Mucilaginibacter sp. cycad4]|uniref:ArnT family glycosyltransferase n=1 Tax=Mucilaginibacter sp. cycad4 TaxID=3342096 RepID=UPI002AAB2A2C|nr:glycosyltransferase family 39 protein [Mucilaginibacter gossypii]WPU99985.1 glycosyltransferase family 39 protein [Mucilaginibacter gossypii]